MSDLATTEVGGEARSAWIYRTLYLDNHSIADNFYCPFCDIRLCPNNIDKDGEISKAPHFSAKWGPHINGCDGTPIVTEPHLRNQPRSHYIARDVKYPEVFTFRPAPRVAQKSEIISPRDTSINAIHQRRGNAGSLLSALFSGTYYTSPCAGDMLVNRKYTSDETSSQINVYPILQHCSLIAVTKLGNAFLELSQCEHTKKPHSFPCVYPCYDPRIRMLFDQL